MTEAELKQKAEVYVRETLMLNEELDPTFKAMADAYIAGYGEAKDINVRTKWHDLRKNPKDLPVRKCLDEEGNIVSLFHNSWDGGDIWYVYDFHEKEWQQMGEAPVAWCEIPRFEEGKNEV